MAGLMNEANNSRVGVPAKRKGRGARFGGPLRGPGPIGNSYVHEDAKQWADNRARTCSGRVQLRGGRIDIGSIRRNDACKARALTRTRGENYLTTLIMGRRKNKEGERIARDSGERGAISWAITLPSPHNDRFAQQWMSVALLHRPALCRPIGLLPRARARYTAQGARVCVRATGQRLFIERAAVNGLV